jgi:hypothetical protein
VNESGGSLTSQQKRKIEEKREEALIRREKRITDEQDQKKRKIEEKREEALIRRKKRITDEQDQKRLLDESRLEKEHRRKRPRTSEASDDPFGEFYEDIPDGEPEPIDAHPLPTLEAIDNGASSSNEPAIRIVPRAKKYAISSAKLQQVKDNADDTWRRHLSNSTRISQLTGTTPSLGEANSGNTDKPRFQIHASHKTMALRSIVHCKLCGYWASKKSQKLQLQCPGKPPHADGMHKLRRLLAGLHPDARVKEWPDGHDARIPSCPVEVDWS